MATITVANHRFCEYMSKIVMCQLASQVVSHYRANHRFCSQNEVARPQGAFAGRATIICALILILRAAYLRGICTQKAIKKFLVPGVPRSDIYELWGFTGLFSKRTKKS